MNGSRIFYEPVTRNKPHPYDRKKALIEGQKVHSRKRETKHSKPTNDFLKQPFRGSGGFSSVVDFVKTKKTSILFLTSCFMIFFSMVPLLIQFHAYTWEKNRTLYREHDILYHLFLKEGGSEDAAEGQSTARAEYTIPTLKFGTYKVKRGDSLFGISHKFNVSVDAILTANNLKNAQFLQIGTELQIPNMSGVFYTVKKGDNLSRIATSYGVKVNAIADLNDLSSEVIHVGEKLFIPGGSLSAWDRAELIGTIFKAPVKGRITSRVGFRPDPFTGMMAYHAGIDIANSVGTPVRAAQYGRVTYAGYRGHYGKTVIIVHPQGYKTVYAHLHKIYVKRGQAVQQGEKIGLLGNTGRSTGPHLHFEVHQKGKLLDPLKVVKMR
jgi:murein DD-endopeptidase MepM/ murein hydrolase activator NlpD